MIARTLHVAGLLLLACMAAILPASASCLPAKTFSSWNWGTGRYLYVHTPADAQNTTASILGRFWQPGAYDTTGNQSCDDANWFRMYPFYPLPTHSWYILGSVGAGGCATAACPASEMIVSVEDRSTNGAHAYFAVGRVDETPGEFDFDFSRTGADWTMVPIPSPGILNTTGGEVFLAGVRFADPASGFHGLPGASPSGTITAFLLYRQTTPVVTRERSTWTLVERYPYAGGVTEGTAVLVCPSTGVVHLAAALEFDDGEVLTHYVSATTSEFCDTYAPGAGAVADGGPDGLFVAREPTGELTLSWGHSCSEGDRISGGYEVYEGTLGVWDSHAPRACSLSPFTTTSLTLTPEPEDTYYLVVPYEDEYEGSYGKRSDGSERPASVSACRQRLINACPF